MPSKEKPYHSTNENQRCAFAVDEMNCYYFNCEKKGKCLDVIEAKKERDSRLAEWEKKHKL